jgi:hypothetical protein
LYCNHYFLEAKIGQTGYSGLNNKFWGALFYDHLSDFLQPDFRFGIFLSLIATISWALVVCIRKKSGPNPYFSLGLQMVISSSLFHHYWSDWHRCQHHQHSGNIMVGDLFSDNRFRFKLYCIYLHDTKTSAGN